jgi:hypothetical protein
MKKIILALCVALCVSAWTNAVQPENLAFEIGLGGVLDADSGDNASLVNFGFSYVFDETMSGGFSFTGVNLNGNQFNISLINITLFPVENVGLRLSTGLSQPPAGYVPALVDSQVIGLGLSYDILTRKSDFFGSLGVFIDWLAVLDNPDGAPFRIDEGGALCIGLRSKIGF